MLTTLLTTFCRHDILKLSTKLKNMNLKEKILQKIKKDGQIKTTDIIKITNFSREYVNRFFRELRNEGKIILIGKANQAHYILADKKLLANLKKQVLQIKLDLKNKDLSEDIILKKIKKETGIFCGLKESVIKIIDYAFLEMLNNAIEHSKSKEIKIIMRNYKDENDLIYFMINDSGVGIFDNIMKKKRLKSRLEAIRELLKGKQTTLPKEHSGQGIFFTSKIADSFIIISFNKKLSFNNKIDDVILEDIKDFSGTSIIFYISANTQRKIEDIFDQYSNNSYEFNKTKVYIKLYQLDTDYISRSQARRILVGLDKFKVIVLDFKNVETVGQAFADEVFRVWNNNYPDIEFQIVNSNENIDFMIKRAQA